MNLPSCDLLSRCGPDSGPHCGIVLGPTFSFDFRLHRNDNERYGYHCGEAGNQTIIWAQKWGLRVDHRTGPRLEWKKDSEATLHCAGSSIDTLDGSGYAHTHDCITLCRTVEQKAHKERKGPTACALAEAFLVSKLMSASVPRKRMEK